ncbi:hypothetical protein [Nocardia otitidiscaviarum]|uniref:hypothetical protein n=1 Tax=Nocardia otitidiscaviarum TaxID=1823 RepID=UPI0024565E44|nr:hypothetical protein [Nocardia otitidiscaviarum]
MNLFLELFGGPWTLLLRDMLLLGKRRLAVFLETDEPEHRRSRPPGGTAMSFAACPGLYRYTPIEPHPRSTA